MCICRSCFAVQNRPQPGRKQQYNSEVSRRCGLLCGMKQNPTERSVESAAPSELMEAQKPLGCERTSYTPDCAREGLSSESNHFPEKCKIRGCPAACVVHGESCCSWGVECVARLSPLSAGSLVFGWARSSHLAEVHPKFLGQDRMKLYPYIYFFLSAMIY